MCFHSTILLMTNILVFFQQVSKVVRCSAEMFKWHDKFVKRTCFDIINYQCSVDEKDHDMLGCRKAQQMVKMNLSLVSDVT